MKNLRLIAIAIALTVVSGAGDIAAAGPAPERSGYWVRVARNASVRMYPGGPEVRAGFRLHPGQYFHVDPKGANGAWALGFACPNGGRYCNSRENIQGFILKSALGARVSSHDAPDVRLAASPAFEVAEASVDTAPIYEPAAFNPFTAAAYGAPFNSSRVVCAREVWVRDNRLHPIGILRRGDRFVVERYTDGSGNSGYPVWALGRAYGRGVNPQGKRGRIMANSLCP